MEIKDLENCKIYTEGNGVEMFNKLIKIGFTTGLTSKEKAFINSPFMFIDKGIIWCGADMDFFKKSSLTEISYTEYSNMNLYPITMSDLSSINFDKVQTFARLISTCQEWNRIDEYVPDWESDKDIKYCIWSEKNEMIVSCICYIHSPFCFGSKKTAELFFKMFKAELLYIKELF